MDCHRYERNPEIVSSEMDGPSLWFASKSSNQNLAVSCGLLNNWVWVKIRYPNNWMVNTNLD